MKAFPNRWLKPRRKANGATHKIRACIAAQALARRILQRYSLRGQSRRGLGMEYLQANRPAGLPQALRLSLHLAQRIERHAHPPLELRLLDAATTAAPTVAGSRPDRPATALMQPPSPGQGRIHMTYLQSLSRLQTISHQRIELGSPDALLRAAVQPVAAGAALPFDRPAPMIARPALLASLPADDAIHRVPAEATPHRSSAVESSAQAVERAAKGLPPGELRGITEQVIQEIDRRIIANRERFGRT